MFFSALWPVCKDVGMYSEVCLSGSLLFLVCSEQTVCCLLHEMFHNLLQLPTINMLIFAMIVPLGQVCVDFLLVVQPRCRIPLLFQ